MAASTALRVLIEEAPYWEQRSGASWSGRGQWPTSWISLPEADLPRPPFVAGYRLRFTVPDEGLNERDPVRVHVTADERYELFLDGERVGRGSERGDERHWFFETYDLTLAPGAHVLAARVWSLGPEAAFAQHTVRHGFLFSPEGEAALALMGTGITDRWEAKPLPGYSFLPVLAAWGTGANTAINGAAFPWGWETGAGEGWITAEKGGKAVSKAAAPNDYDPTRVRPLAPALLPAQKNDRWDKGTVRLVSDPGGAFEDQTNAIPVRSRDHLSAEAGAWSALFAGLGAVTVPAETRRRVLVDLEDYLCAYPEVTVSGGDGARVRVNWAEALYNEHTAKTKGNRNEIEDKFFVNHWYNNDGVGDLFLPGGGETETFTPLWWQCGRYVEVLVETKDAPLTLTGFAFHETRYPLERESRFGASDARLDAIAPILVRALQMCSHETYMDCPYYEQLQYVGDTRLEVLTTYLLTHDDRLPRKALQMFDLSRQLSGLTLSRYPSRVVQIIPPFSLWWVAMVHDFSQWRNDPDFVRARMPGVRTVLEAFLSYRNTNGLVETPPGWNFIDWVTTWKNGMPLGADIGVSGVLNWQFALVLTRAADLERQAGEPELAARLDHAASDLAEALQHAFWTPERGLFADDLDRTAFSEHAQCLAILSGLLPPAQQASVGENLIASADLAPTTIYFRHYLFETLALLRRPDLLLDRMRLWFDLPENGLKTTIEMPEPTRSDCHAWGAYPLYHYAATILGIRPAAPGFAAVRIAPQLGPLEWASATVPHPSGGEIAVRAERGADGALTVTVTLPGGVGGFAQGAAGEPIVLPDGARGHVVRLS
ncbi:MAG: alpha-L-rhamnosidase [Cytophagales bacterium]|nr:alpha-L-rhamnosidase [Armatimonadota bacterium]